MSAASLYERPRLTPLAKEQPAAPPLDVGAAAALEELAVGVADAVDEDHVADAPERRQCCTCACFRWCMLERCAASAAVPARRSARGASVLVNFMVLVLVCLRWAVVFEDLDASGRVGGQGKSVRNERRGRDGRRPERASG